MLKIRLKRVGRRNHPSFRVVVTESSKGPKSGKVVDTLGFYEPMAGKKEIDGERAGKWISNGAQPSDTVHNMLVDIGVVKDKKINALPKKSPIVKEEEDKPSEAKAQAPTEEGALQEEAVAEEGKTEGSAAEESADASAESAGEKTESTAEEPKQEEEKADTPEEGSEEEKS